MMGVDAMFVCTTDLFRGTTPDEVEAMLGCLGARAGKYKKGEVILREGEVTSSIGLVLQGSVRLESSDVWGNTSMIGLFGQGETFGEAYAALPGRSLLASAIAAEPSTVLFTEVRHIVSRCPKECSYHAQVNANLLASIARKNLYLSQRILDSAPKSIRGKLLAYLSTQSKAAGTREFDIPFSRQQLADYLGVDRSALSSVISELRRDKVLRSQRSHFELL